MSLILVLLFTDLIVDVVLMACFSIVMQILCILLLPTVHGLNELVSIGCKYTNEHDIILNEIKRICIFKLIKF